MKQFNCPFCQQCLQNNQYSQDCNNHQGMIIRFYYSSRYAMTDQPIYQPIYIINYKESIYAIKCFNRDCRIEEWAVNPTIPERFIYVKTVLQLNRVPDNLTPETALNKLKMMLLFS